MKQLKGLLSLQIRPYRPGDEEEINRSFNQVFGLHRTLEEWRRKFPDPTFTMLAVTADGRVAGQYAAIPVPLQVEGRQILAGTVVDVFTTATTRRGLGAARAMLATTEEFFSHFGGASALSVLYGFPGTRHFRLGVARLGYDSMPPEEVPVWRVSPRPRRRFFWGVEILEDPPRPLWEELWQAASPRYPVAGVRDWMWLERRFPPAGEYSPFVVLRRGCPVLGGVVCRRDRVLYWAELVWAGERQGLAAAAEYCRALAWERRCQLVELWLAGDAPAARVLEESGWQVAPHHALRRVARSFDPAVDVATFPGRFLLTLGDTDLV